MLTVKDLNVVLTSSIDAKTKWDFIGLALGISPSELDAIEEEYDSIDRRFKNMLKKWLKMAVNPPPSWQGLVMALRSKTVGHDQLAKAIEKEYIIEAGGICLSWIHNTMTLNNSYSFCEISGEDCTVFIRGDCIFRKC